jgi:hypothetical protein
MQPPKASVYNRLAKDTKISLCPTMHFLSSGPVAAALPPSAAALFCRIKFCKQHIEKPALEDPKRAFMQLWVIRLRGREAAGC